MIASPDAWSDRDAGRRAAALDDAARSASAKRHTLIPLAPPLLPTAAAVTAAASPLRASPLLGWCEEHGVDEDEDEDDNNDNDAAKVLATASASRTARA